MLGLVGLAGALGLLGALGLVEVLGLVEALGEGRWDPPEGQDLAVPPDFGGV